MPTNPQTHPFYKVVDFRVNGRAPRGQCAALRLELGQDLFICRRDPIERTVQIDPFFVHDDGDNIVGISPRLLDVVRVHVLVVFVRWDGLMSGIMQVTDVSEQDGFCDQSEERFDRGMFHNFIWNVQADF